MDTLKLKQTRLVILKYLLQLIGMALFFYLLLVTTNHFISYAVQRISVMPYFPNANFRTTITILLIVYVLFSYLFNNFMLDLFHKEKAKQLSFSLLADWLIVPFQVLIMIIFNNHFEKNQFLQIISLYNVYLVTILLIIKNIIALRILSGSTLKIDKQKRSVSK